MAEVTLRQASYSDIPQIAQLFADAFQDDDLIGDIIHPHRKQHPQDMKLWFLRGARVGFWDYRWRWLVAAHKVDGRERIVGCAQWHRMGDGGKEMDLWWFDPRNLLKPLSVWAMRIHALLWPNRACDAQQLDVIERAYPFVSHLWSGDRAECWNLEACGVHPTYQGQGIGRLLVQRGLGWAERDGVCASVTAAEGKDEFYRKCGFHHQEGQFGMGAGNPLAGGKGGNMWWRLLGSQTTPATATG